ncbi:MAG TPA: methyltransferase domain-containing protein [Patescibacteria group bacterium]|nr:methyltransferase domain-containing protein [Patescibacteria group bacterium]
MKLAYESLENRLVQSVVPPDSFYLTQTIKDQEFPAYADLIASFVEQTDAYAQRILTAIRDTDRKAYMPQALPRKLKEYAFLDYSFKQTGYPVMTRPSTLFGMIRLLSLQEKGANILHIGGGSGYTDEILSRITGEDGHIYSVEINETSAHRTENNLQRRSISNVTVICADGANGLPEHGPYDGILYTAALAFISDAVKAQLLDGGRIVAPVGNAIIQRYFIPGNVHQVTRNGDNFYESVDTVPVRFMPVESEKNGAYTRLALDILVPSARIPFRRNHQ